MKFSVFLGPNGAGKTTTINILTGLARPTSGSLFFKGQNYTANIKKAQAIIGIVPDESNLYDEMNGFENLCFCAVLFWTLNAFIPILTAVTSTFLGLFISSQQT